MSAAAAESTSGEHCFLFRQHQAARFLYWKKFFSNTSSEPLYQHALLGTHTTILLAVIAATSMAVSTKNLASILAITMLYQLYRL